MSISRETLEGARASGAGATAVRLGRRDRRDHTHNFVHYQILGATFVGFAFVLPLFLVVAALGWAYAHFGGLSRVYPLIHAHAT
jgi:chromate transport protein ChrA